MFGSRLFLSLLLCLDVVDDGLVVGFHPSVAHLVAEHVDGLSHLLRLHLRNEGSGGFEVGMGLDEFHDGLFFLLFHGLDGFLVDLHDGVLRCAFLQHFHLGITHFACPAVL